MKECNVKENKQVEEAINYFEDREISMKVDVDTDKLLKALGVTEEDSFDKQVYRMKTLINRIKELEKENTLYKLTFGEPPVYESEIILKQKIRDKIEELEKQRDNVKIFKNIDEYDRCIGKIEVLNELLEED